MTKRTICENCDGEGYTDMGTSACAVCLGAGVTTPELLSALAARRPDSNNVDSASLDAMLRIMNDAGIQRGEDRTQLRARIQTAVADAIRQCSPRAEPTGTKTDALISRFAAALKAKLRASEAKYGWQNGWLKADWQADCQHDLARHVAKGDPLDVAAYAAFCWHHGWPAADKSVGAGDDEAANLDGMAEASRVIASKHIVLGDEIKAAYWRGRARGLQIAAHNLHLSPTMPLTEEEAP